MLDSKTTERIEKILGSADVLLVMKGDKFQPQCGFSAKVAHILNLLNVNYSTFDILEDEEIRKGLKKYADWPTFPQLYVKGELIGGSDIVGEMLESGELQELFDSLND
jgi:monothiol glutaredoxin